MKDRRLLKGLRAVALSLGTDVGGKADPFSLLQSIAVHCGLRLDDDGLVATREELKHQNASVLVRGPSAV